MGFLHPPAARVFLSLAVALLAASTLEGAELRLVLDWKGGEPTPITAVLSADRGEVGRFRLGVGPRVALEVPANQQLWLRFEAEGWWARSRPLLLAADGADATIELWPAGVLAGRLLPDGDGPVPEAVEISLAAAAAGALEAATLECRVEEATFECPAPAGYFDLALSVDGYGPARRWGVDLRHRRTHQLGVIELARGTTVDGRVALAAGAALPGDLEIELARPGSAKKPAAEALASVGATPRGRFQFLGVEPGAYVVRISHPQFFPTASPPFEIGQEPGWSLPQPLVLVASATLDLAFDPAVDPFGEPWKFTLRELRPASPEEPTVIRDSAELSGLWSRGQLAAGPYRLTVTSKAMPRVAEREIELRDEHTLVQVELRFIGVRGRVTSGRQPIRGRLRFSRSQPRAAASFRSDERGRFEGYLPSGGAWVVHVEAPEQGFDVSAGLVEVEAVGRGGVAQIEIELPETTIEGQVVDPDGLPVAGARVVVQWLHGAGRKRRVRLRTDDLGRFEGHGYPIGSVIVRPEMRGVQPPVWTPLEIEIGVNRVPTLVIESAPPPDPG